jgi:hypothetical protein
MKTKQKIFIDGWDIAIITAVALLGVYAVHLINVLNSLPQ